MHKNTVFSNTSILRSAFDQPCLNTILINFPLDAVYDAQATPNTVKVITMENAARPVSTRQATPSVDSGPGAITGDEKDVIATG